MTEPLRIAVDVACPPERAFELWTERTSVWWPASHTVSGRDDIEVIIEPRVGGRIYERTPDGEEHDWGEVIGWNPPAGFSYVWHLRQDRADATEVEITFSAGDPDGTRLSIEHRGWNALGARGADRRDLNQHGWAGLLPHFQAVTHAA